MTWYENVIHTCLGVQPGDKVLLLTDAGMEDSRRLLEETIQKVGPSEFFSWVLPEDERPLKTAPPEILERVRTYDVGIHFLSYTSVEETPYRIAIVKAIAEGGKIRLCAGLHIDEAILANEMSADYTEVAALTLKLRDALAGRSDVHITSPLGTDIRFSIAGRPIAIDPGVVRAPGFYNLPAGECYVAPLEDSANGMLVVDKSLPGLVIDEPVRLTFENGRVVAIDGGEEARWLTQAIKEGEQQPDGEGCRTIAELGIGTNPAARITGNVMTDEKVMGTIHIAIGHNANPPYNGKNKAPIHLDGVMGSPTLIVDGKMLIDSGRYLVK
jgi:leucyl aminopeptidase (aminopeptidase T)